MRHGSEKVGINTYKCITPNSSGNLLKYINKKEFRKLRLDTMSHLKVWLKWGNSASKMSNLH